jgi:Xaa-Pro aminopeptidase
MVAVELATCVDGYWSDLTRTGVVGAPDEKQAALLAAVREAQEAAIREVRVGVTCGQVDAAARRILNERGYGAGFTHSTGHQVGLRYHDPGPALEASSTVRLEAGMIVTVEPGVYGAAFGGGARFEDNILVTEDGPISLSPHELVGANISRG